MERALTQAFAWIEELYHELHLPGVSIGAFMNRPSLRHRGASIIGSKDGPVLVASCPLDMKDILLEAEPHVYFETDHYKGYPAILVRPETVDKDTLRTRIIAAWRMNATKAQLAAYNDTLSQQ